MKSSRLTSTMMALALCFPHAFGTPAAEDSVVLLRQETSDLLGGQVRAICYSGFRELFEWAADMNITTFFFAAFDESWKGDPNDPLGAEKHWGLFTEARVPKLVMKQ